MGYRPRATAVRSNWFSNTARLGSIALVLLLLLGAISSNTLSRTSLASSHSATQWVQANQVPKGLTAQDWKAIQASIERDQYRFEEDAKSQTYHAFNAAQGLSISLSSQGFTVSPPGLPWQWGLTLRSYGFAQDQQAVASVSETRVPAVNRLEYVRGELVEWYVNERRGLEQGFTILQRPKVGAQADGPLQVVLSLRGNGQARQAGDQGLSVEDEQGQELLSYSQLMAYDASGKRLPARMKAGKEEVILEGAGHKTARELGEATSKRRLSVLSDSQEF
jgi:hypothetical protein